MALMTVFLIVNMFQIAYAVLLSMIKDMFTRGLGILEFAFWRSLFNMTASAIVVKCVYKETFFSGVPKDLRSTLIVRCASGTLAFLCYTTSPQFMPLGIL